MSKNPRGWTGSTVKRARDYWRRRILDAYLKGEPLMCAFSGTDPRCTGAVLPTDTWHVDHRVARADGGAVLRRSNQWPAHATCNTRASAKRTNEARTQRTKRLWSW